MKQEIIQRIKKYTPQSVKKKQYITAFIAGVIICIGIAAKDIFKSTPQEKPILKNIKKVDLSGVSYDLKGEDRWMELSGEKMSSMDKKQEVLEGRQTKLEKQLSELDKIANTYQGAKGEKGDTSYSAQIESLRADVAILKEQLVNRRSNESAKISQIEIELEGKKSKKKGYSIENYLPAMSYVKATVISGVDASVGINATSDPRPTLFRITGKANSAMYEGKGQLIDLRGCMVLGSARGDLSSERTFIRLEKMSCSFSDGIVHEMKVNGYAAGVGKAGMRGKVVSREGDLVIQSGIAGVIGGVGGGIADRYKNPTSVLGIGSQPESKDIMRSGLGAGVQNSTDRISDYLIKRAEQYQPVIMLPAGSEAELVFTEGVYLDGGNKE